MGKAKYGERNFREKLSNYSHAVRIVTEVVLDVFISGVNLFSSVAKG